MVRRPADKRLILCVLLPFAVGYYLSYLFRTITALIAGDLAADLALSAADLGLVSSVYFLVFAAAQLPLGALLDAHGPRAIASALLLFASAGALIFAGADGLLFLLIGRALIGLGVSLALMAGLKAIVLWFPSDRRAVANGALVMLGALGAVTAAQPAEMVVAAIGWRGLFAVLAALSAASALVIVIAVPDASATATEPAAQPSIATIYRDRRFWRLAPISSLAIGTSWSLQGLWAAPWLRDVAGLDRTGVVAHLGFMALAVAASAMLLGLVADRLRRRGVPTEVPLAATFALSMAAQAALLLGLPLPSQLLWALIGAAGAATVLSFAIVTGHFPSAMSGRANAALNLLHIGAAFLLQSATGFIIALWPHQGSGYPPQAHQAAMGTILVLQVAAFAWFALPPRALPPLPATLWQRGRASINCARLAAPSAFWRPRAAAAAGWPVAASAAMLLSSVLGAALLILISEPAIAVHVVEKTSRAAASSASLLNSTDDPTAPLALAPSSAPTKEPDARKGSARDRTSRSTLMIPSHTGAAR